MSKEYDVVIIGAGPVGLTLALELNRQGIKNIAIFEKELNLCPYAKASIIHCGTMDLLHNYPDLISRITPELNLIKSVHFEKLKNDTLKLINKVSVEEKTDYRVSNMGAYMHGQFKTQTALLDVLKNRGVKVNWGCEITNFTQDEEHVNVEAGNKWIRSKFLVGADGSHSFVRNHMGINKSGESIDDIRMIICHLEVSDNDTLQDDIAYLLTVKKPIDMFICPLADNHLYLILPQTPEESKIFETELDHYGKMNVRDPTEEEILERIESLLKLKNFEVKEIKWKKIYRMSTYLSEDYLVGRVALVGDACHSNPPIGGYGMNTGIHDAINLGWKLAMELKGFRGIGIKYLMNSYHDERYPVGKLLCDTSHDRTKNLSYIEQYTGFMYKIMTKMTSLIPNSILQYGDLSKAFLYDNLYRNSILSETHGSFSGGSIIAGDRAPLGIEKIMNLCTSSRGFKILLLIYNHTMYKDYIHYLYNLSIHNKYYLSDVLVYTSTTKQWWKLKSETELLTDRKETVDLFKVFGVHYSGAFVIRPDNYIAFRSEPADLNLIHQYMIKFYNNCNSSIKAKSINEFYYHDINNKRQNEKVILSKKQTI